MSETIVAILLFVGAAFVLLASVGVLRLPDLFTRMQAATKAATLGSDFLLLAVAVFFEDLGVTTRALAAVAFITFTAPIAAHMIGRAAYFVSVPLWEGTIIDELRGRYEPRTHILSSTASPAEETRNPASNAGA